MNESYVAVPISSKAMTEDPCSYALAFSAMTCHTKLGNAGKTSVGMW